MINIKKELNQFFVECFYTILGVEERNLEAISNGKVTLKEIHVIEAVFTLLEKKENTFSNTAKLLGVSLGTFTTAFNKLARKGYLRKEQDIKDKRVYYIFPTKLAELINDEHVRFHEAMTEIVISKLPEAEQIHLINALKQLSIFFRDLTIY